LAGGLLTLYATGGYAQDVSPEKQPAIASITPIKTGKARLSNKANDNQRMDNCKVPLELRGNEQRPEGCKVISEEYFTRSG
jgi:hypothetical protein